MSALVLLGSSSFAVVMHFCMGELEAVALFSEASHCDMAEAQGSKAGSHMDLGSHGANQMSHNDPSEQPHQTSRKDHSADKDPSSQHECCENHAMLVDGEVTSLTQSGLVIPLPQEVVDVDGMVTAQVLGGKVQKSREGYSPPRVQVDRPTRFQTFLI